MSECPHLAPRSPTAALTSDHGPVVVRILMAVAAKERSTRMAYSQAKGWLHESRSDSPCVRQAGADVL